MIATGWLGVAAWRAGTIANEANRWDIAMEYLIGRAQGLTGPHAETAREAVQEHARLARKELVRTGVVAAKWPKHTRLAMGFVESLGGWEG